MWKSQWISSVDPCALQTSTRPLKVTLGAQNQKAYLKLKTNPEGPTALARELVGTALAARFGLKTFEYAVRALLPAEVQILKYLQQQAEQGDSIFLTLEDVGLIWDGLDGSLNQVANSEDFTKLVVFDTWLRNHDRCPPPDSGRRPNFTNVWLAPTGVPKQLCMKTIDHTHWDARRSGRGERISLIEAIRDEKTYGLFDGWKTRLQVNAWKMALNDLSALAQSPALAQILQAVPSDWGVDARLLDEWHQFLADRAQYLCNTRATAWQQELGL